MNFKHGANRTGKKTTEYQAWVDINQRCHNPKCRDYINYGARSIVVCPRWRVDFKNFFHDMGPRPAGMTLERKDNDGNYEPGNCKWATRKEQARNRRSSRRLTLNGQTHTIAKWQELSGLPGNLISQRLNKLGWSIKRALTEPSNLKKE